jgi:hypothetical protein
MADRYKQHRILNHNDVLEAVIMAREAVNKVFTVNNCCLTCKDMNNLDAATDFLQHVINSLKERSGA